MADLESIQRDCDVAREEAERGISNELTVRLAIVASSMPSIIIEARELRARVAELEESLGNVDRALEGQRKRTRDAGARAFEAEAAYSSAKDENHEMQLRVEKLGHELAAATCPVCEGDNLSDVAEEFEHRSDAAAVLSQYLKMHEGKIGMHWIYAAIGRMCAGDSEVDVMGDYGWVRVHK